MDVVNLDEVDEFITADGSTIRELLNHRNSLVRNQSLAEARLSPGCSTTPHHHPLAEEIYYILRGAGAMVVAGDHQTVRAGDAIAIHPGQRHTITNIGTDELVFLCMCSPGYEHADTVLDTKSQT